MHRFRMLLVVSAVSAMLALVVVPTPALAGHTSYAYDWKLSCKSSTGTVFGSASWNWTEGGSPIPGAGGTVSFSDCGGMLKLGGEGPRPGNADGLLASLRISGGCFSAGPAYCYDFSSASWSFDPLKRFNTGLSVYFSAYDLFCEVRDCSVSGSADWSLQSWGV